MKNTKKILINYEYFLILATLLLKFILNTDKFIDFANTHLWQFYSVVLYEDIINSCRLLNTGTMGKKQSTKDASGPQRKGRKANLSANRVRDVNPRPKNMLPNTATAMSSIIRTEFPQIKYQLRKKKLKSVEIVIFCLQARKYLALDQLQKFKKIIISIVATKLTFQEKKKLEPVRAKNIEVLRMLMEITMEAINEGESCIKDVLKKIFDCKVQGTGKSGREAIQKNKIQSQNYIKRVMEGEEDMIEEDMNRTFQSQSLQQENDSSANQQLSSSELKQMGVQTSQADFAQEMSQSELMGEMRGDQFVETATLSHSHSKVLILGDFFERKQEEIKYRLLCKTYNDQTIASYQAGRNITQTV